MTNDISQSPLDGVLQFLELGAFDSELDTMMRAIFTRQKIIRMQTGMKFSVNKRVRFIHLPENRLDWKGVEGTVVGSTKNGESIKVQLADDTLPIYVGKRRAPLAPGEIWTVPSTWLELL